MEQCMLTYIYIYIKTGNSDTGFILCFHYFSRPGILVLVNDTDWELLDGLNCPLKNQDEVVFISTLHGG